MKKSFNYKRFNNKSRGLENGLLPLSSILATLLVLITINFDYVSVDMFGLQANLNVVLYSLLFPVSYLIHEKAGKEKAKKSITAGLISLLLISIALFNTQDLGIWAYVKSMVLLLVYFFAPLYLSIWVYGILKYRSNYKKIWLRAGIGMLLGQSLALAIIAFDRYNSDALNSVELQNIFMFSIILSAVYIIVIYAGLLFLKRRLSFNMFKKSRTTKNEKHYANDAKGARPSKKYGENPRRNQSNGVRK